MNTFDQTHPTRDRLAAFSAGKLNSSDSDGIEHHLSECDSCCQILKELPEDDTLVNLLRGDQSDTSVSPDLSPSLAKTVVPEFKGATEPICDEATISPGGHATKQTPGLPPELRDHGRYRIVRLLGRGGMGDVYQAEHKVMSRPVALKIIKPKLIGNETAVRRFRREVQAAARLRHPNIVTAFDAEQAGDLHYLVMEFVEGVDLDEVIKNRGPLAVAEACDYIRQTAEGLQHAHELGMVHRDIKPHNLMIETSATGSEHPRHGVVKILDFGLANFANETAVEEAQEAHPDHQAPTVEVLDQLTQMGTMMGTPDYIAPEQAVDARQADIRADIYSLGCTFYTLLAGHAPYRGGSVAEKLAAHAQQDPEPISKFRDDLPEEVETILQKMMAKAPAERYQTPAEVAEVLRPHCQTAVAPARTRSSWRMLAGIAGCVLAIIALAVYYIQTDYGVVRVEVNDERLQVKLDGQTITMQDGDKELKIRPGEQTLSVERDDGFNFETEKFQLRRREEITVRVELLRGQVLVFKDGERFGTKSVLDWEPKPLPSDKSSEPAPQAPLTIGMNDEFGMLFQGRLVAPAELSRRLDEALAKDPERVVAIDLPKRPWTVAPHVDQLEQIARTMGAKHITRPAWSEIRVVFDVINTGQQILDIKGPGFNATGFTKAHLPSVRQVIAKNPGLPVLLDIGESVDLSDPKQSAGFDEVRRVAEAAGAKVRLGPRSNKLKLNELRVVYDERNGNPVLKINGKTVQQVEDVLLQIRTRLTENPKLIVVLDIGPGLDSESVRDLMVADRVRKTLSATGATVRFSAQLASAVQYRQLREERENALKQIGLALHSYHDTHKFFPPTPHQKEAFDENGKPYLSWRVHLLPYLEQEELYQQFRLDEPWDSEHNKPLLAKIPAQYKTADDPTKTTLLAIVGAGTAYEGHAGLKAGDITAGDGMSNTAFVVDAGRERAVPWTKPDDLPLDSEDPIRAFGTSDFSDEFLALMCDGFVKSIPYDTHPEQLRNLFLRNDGNPLDLNAKRKTPLPTPPQFELVGKLPGTESTVNALVFLPDGRRLVSADKGHVVSVWDVPTQKLIETLPAWDQRIRSMALLPDGRVATGGEDGGIRIWNLEVPEKSEDLPGHPSFTMALAVSPDGKRLVSGAFRETIRLWNLETGKELHRADANCGAAYFLNAGKQIIHLDQNQVVIRDTETFQVVRTIAKVSPNRHLLVLGVSADEKYVATGDIEVFCHELATGKLVARFPVLERMTMIRGLVFVPGTPYLISGDDMPELRLFDVSAGTELATRQLTSHSAYALALSPDGRLLASGGGTWKTSTGQYREDPDKSIWLWQLPPSLALRKEPQRQADPVQSSSSRS